MEAPPERRCSHLTRLWHPVYYLIFPSKSGEPKRVKEIVEDAVLGVIDIPEFQRQFVWEPDDVKALAESLHRDYPIGNLLLWNNEDYQSSRGAHGEQTRNWIVDGQQRITSLSLILGRKPYWWPDHQTWLKALKRNEVLVNIFPKAEEALFGLPNPVRRRDLRWVSVTEIIKLPNEKVLEAYAKQLATKVKRSNKEQSIFDIYTRIKKVWDMNAREIPQITIAHEIEDVVEIFARLNQQGVQVKEADVIVAIISSYHPDWVRDSFLPFVKEMEDKGFDLEPGVFIRSVTGYALGRAQLKEIKKSFWQDEFLSDWQTTQAAIVDVFQHFRNKGLLSGDLLPSKNSLIPLFVLRAKFGDEFDFDYAFRCVMTPKNWRQNRRLKMNVQSAAC